MRKVFVAGHKGLVGSAVCRVAIETNIELVLRDVVVDLLNQRELLSSFRVSGWMPLLCAAKVGGILANKSRCSSLLMRIAR